jgi:beta-lactamase class A
MRIGIIIAVIVICIAFAGCAMRSQTGDANRTGATPKPGAPTPMPPKPDIQLQKQIAEIAKEGQGEVGVFAELIETGETVSLNPDAHFAMQSVVKLPVSMAVLQLISEGKVDMDELIAVKREDYVRPNSRSPILYANPHGVELTVRELIRYAISESDGSASDVLQHLAGDAKGVQAYLNSLGIRGIQIEHTHKEFGREWALQYENWETPAATVQLLKKLFAAEGITGEHRDLLLGHMIESHNPPKRLKGMLPPGTVVAHKTGTGGNQNGIAAATNDVGIIKLPNGNHVAIAVLIVDSTADHATRDAVIAKIAKAAFDKWSLTSAEYVKPANFNERHTLN